MKRQGYRDEDIVTRLVDQGFTEYKPPSISSRYSRICRKMQERNEELLDEELTDWHDGEVSRQQTKTHTGGVLIHVLGYSTSAGLCKGRQAPCR